MLEQNTEQLCALFDGELPAEEVELLLNRLEKDAALKATWCRYQTMRDVIQQGIVICDYTALQEQVGLSLCLS